MDMRKQALEEERKRREELEKRLQEETSRRQKLIEREVKLREKQRVQVRTFKYCHLNENFVLWTISCWQKKKEPSVRESSCELCYSSLLNQKKKVHHFYFILFSLCVHPVPPADPVPASAKGWLWPAGSHWVGGPQRRHVLPPVHLWEDLPWLPGENGRKDQDLEETVVRFWPQPTHALLLCR